MAIYSAWPGLVGGGHRGGDALSSHTLCHTTAGEPNLRRSAQKQTDSRQWALLSGCECGGDCSPRPAAPSSPETSGGGMRPTQPARAAQQEVGAHCLWSGGGGNGCGPILERAAATLRGSGQAPFSGGEQKRKQSHPQGSLCIRDAADCTQQEAHEAGGGAVPPMGRWVFRLSKIPLSEGRQTCPKPSV